MRLADGIALRHDLAAGAVPYADPDGGGVDSRVLLLLNDPGDGAQFDTGGSGMLTILNEDQTSRKQRAAVEASGLTARRVTEEVQIISARARHLAFHHSTHPERSSNAALFAAYRWAADITTR